MATIKDVARLAGVSVATVSRVINNSPKASEASRLAVHSAMESLSYHPNANARALAQQTTETVGLVVGDVSDPFFGAMVKAVEQVAYHTGNFLLIGNGYHNEQKERQAIEQLIRHRCAALVVHAKMIPDADLASLMKQMPGMVLINRILPGFENRCIALDDRYGAWLATRHLIQQGHTRIGYLCSNHSISDAEDRLQGYYDALAESGIAANDPFRLVQADARQQGRPVGQRLHGYFQPRAYAAPQVGSGFVQHGNGGSRAHVHHNQRRAVFMKSRHIPGHQVGAHVGRVINENIQPGFDSGTNHQAVFPRQFADGRAECVQHRRHNRGHNTALNVLNLCAVQIQHGF